MEERMQMEQEVTLEQMLEARERRVQRQRARHLFPDAVAHGDRGTDALPHRGADADTRTDAGAARSL
ncbi:MAG: hypothetical protein BHW33_02700 [Firmicutes bacterium CAG:137_57_8]|nr:MAG: hypothetical protein BHW33_02700 [Firmicutes bacterium CAG:137_57_8]